MPTLTIRNIPEEQHAALRVRAAKAGRSMEEEVRVMLAAQLAAEQGPSDRVARALAARDHLQALLRAANGGVLPTGMVDELIAERRAEAAREVEEALKPPR